MSRILWILIVAAGCLSCNRMLDVKPTDQLTDDEIWKTPANADLFLNDIYNSLNAGPWSSIWTNVPSEVSNDPLDNYSDNSLNGNIAGILSYQLFANGSYGPSNQIFGPHWSRMYANIRKCNLFLEKVAASGFANEVRIRMLAQARFLRAYYYASLVNWYGGVPLITTVLNRNNPGDSINYPRNTYEECVRFIQQQCKQAADSLPVAWTGKDIGRATRGAALALKGELELYAGKWQEAAATNSMIIQSGVYQLYPEYGALFRQDRENNAEVIFDVQYAPFIKGHSRDTYWGVTTVADGFGWGSVNPTQDLVDSYEFLDGRLESEGSALFDPQHPYSNRDKRFYASIIYDGAEWRGGKIYTRLGIPNNKNELDLSGAGGKERTGYYMRKLLDTAVVPGRDNLNNGTGGSNAIVFRYAEVLLNFAEAQNEVAGPGPGVYAAMDSVRHRAGLPSLPAGLDQEGMRRRIRRERLQAAPGRRLHLVGRI